MLTSSAKQVGPCRYPSDVCIHALTSAMRLCSWVLISLVAVQDPRRYFDAAAGSVTAQQVSDVNQPEAARSMLQALSRINPAALAQPLLPPSLAAKVLRQLETILVLEATAQPRPD